MKIILKTITLILILLINIKTLGQNNTFDNVKPINIEGLNLSFANKNNKFGLIDNSNKIIIPLEYTSIKLCNENNLLTKPFVIVKKDNKSMIASLKNGQILSNKFDEIECFSNEDFSIVKQSNKFGIISNKFNLTIPPVYDYLFIAEYYKPNFSIIGVKLNNKFGFVDINNNIIIPIKYEWVNNIFSDDLVWVKLNGKYGVISINGEELIRPKYDEIINGFKDGKSLVKLDKQFINIDTLRKETFVKDPIETDALIKKEDGIIINGVRWATNNVNEEGSFAETPQSMGKLYQWSKNDPSPKGWRIPNIEEINSLLDEKKVESIQTVQNGVAGRLFTDIISRESIFFPNAGRINSNGELDDFEYEGFYWSNKKIEDETNYAYCLHNRSNFNWRVKIAGGARNKILDTNYAISIRPVANIQ